MRINEHRDLDRYLARGGGGIFFNPNSFAPISLPKTHKQNVIAIGCKSSSTVKILRGRRGTVYPPPSIQTLLRSRSGPRVHQGI